MERNTGVTCKFVLAILFLAPAAYADQYSYISDVSTIDRLYEACLETVARTANIHCVRGEDKVAGEPASGESPYDVFYKSANKTDLDRNNPEDQRVLESMKLRGDSPNSGSKMHYAFVTIYRDFYSYGRVPVVKAIVSLVIVQEGSAGIGSYPDESVATWLQEELASLSMARTSSAEGKQLSAKYQAIVDAEVQRQRNEAERVKEETKPSCSNIVFTGIASAAAPALIEQALSSSDIDDTLARNPITCSGFSCYGIGYFSYQEGRIVNWDRNYYFVNSAVDFDVGRRDILLAIKREDATCIE
ncbi:MAG: hypothetical protein H7A05_08065 [Pseudomonadales bacterium]|nr:hypothetical protein [Pseudomonadales bacterium]